MPATLKEKHVLTLTENASNAVTTIVGQAAGGSADAGLRIAEDPASASLGLAVVESPLPGDEVVEESGARVFLDEKAHEALDDKVLDAEYQANGGVQFTIAPQS
ncbi:MAG TPA: Fe-S cluster assembly protein HesB [Nocardioidaceae bacterium]|nr:Fe-S cluster assembly protein HesB [Nocardioidaceae bacterium]